MPAVLSVSLVCLVLLAAAYDLGYRRIPNWLTLSGMILGVGCNTLLFGLPGLRGAAFGLLCALLVYLPLYLIRGMGAGDVKLMAAVGAVAGPERWCEIFLATALIAGAASLVIIARKHRVRQTFRNLSTIVSELLSFHAPTHKDPQLDMRNQNAVRLPHGAAIAAGSLVFLLFHAPR